MFPCQSEDILCVQKRIVGVVKWLTAWSRGTVLVPETKLETESFGLTRLCRCNSELIL